MGKTLLGGCLLGSFYQIIHYGGTPSSFFPWKSIWRLKTLIRVAFFVWTAALGKILTVDNLRKRRIIIVDWCCMCKHQGDSVDNLLLHCDMARELWSMVLCLFGVQRVMRLRVVDMLASWKGRYGRHRFGAIPSCIMWIIWRERNHRTFVVFWTFLIPVIFTDLLPP
jgi:hypothetical protein